MTSIGQGTGTDAPVETRCTVCPDGQRGTRACLCSRGKYLRPTVSVQCQRQCCCWRTAGLALRRPRGKYRLRDKPLSPRFTTNVRISSTSASWTNEKRKPTWNVLSEHRLRNPDTAACNAPSVHPRQRRHPQHPDTGACTAPSVRQRQRRHRCPWTSCTNRGHRAEPPQGFAGTMLYSMHVDSTSRCGA